LAKWSPELRLRAFKVSDEKSEILVEELAEIIYDYIASSEKSNLVTDCGPAESKLNEENKFFKKAGSDG